jgi:hypothetical protein
VGEVAVLAAGRGDPLIASEKMLRSALAWLPIAAITSAARRAAVFSSATTSRSMATVEPA